MRDGRREQQAEDKRGAVTDKEGWEEKGRWRPCKGREESRRRTGDEVRAREKKRMEDRKGTVENVRGGKDREGRAWRKLERKSKGK